MAKQIESLTAEQVARFGEFREIWLKAGLSTERADRAEAERGVELAYRAAGFEPPAIKIWMPSPFAGVLATAYVAEIARTIGKLPAPQRAAIARDFGDNSGAQAGAQVRDQVGAQVRDQVGAQVGAQMSNAIWGQHEAGWSAFYDYFGSVLGLACVDRLAGLLAVARSSGWWWPMRGAVVLTERPSFIARDERGRLHCENRAAIEYPDGWGVYAWHGLRVQRYITDAGAKVIHEDKDHLGLARRLVRKDRGGDTPLMGVFVENSTVDLPDGKRRQFFLRVHPELRPLLGKDEAGSDRFGEPQNPTCQNAVASTFGMTGEEYAPLVQT